MSLILDALRKLDREKASRRKGIPHIASEILRPDHAGPPKRKNLYIIALSLTALVTAGLTYAVVVGVGIRGKPAPQSPSISPGPNQSTLAAPPKPGPSSKPLPSAPASPPVLRKQAAAVPLRTGSPGKTSPPSPEKSPVPSKNVAAGPPKAPVMEKSSPPVPVTPPDPQQQVAAVPPSGVPARDVRTEPGQVPSKVSAPAASPAEKKPSQNVLPQEVEASSGIAKKPGLQAVDENSSTPPPLKITGIVWHEEPSKRRVVINGSFLTEGTMIEGVKVLEIFPTKVRFLHKGQSFEISVF